MADSHAPPGGGRSERETWAAKVEIGPFAVIGPNVTLGDRVKIHSHAVVTGNTEVGEGCEIHPFA